MASLPPTNAIESEPCTRCGGSGHYSYCSMYGTVCFRCNGRKRTLTARGAATSTFLRGLREVAGDQIKAGDVIKLDGAVRRVVEVRQSASTYTREGEAPVHFIELVLQGGRFYGVTPESKVYRVDDKATQAAQWRQAMRHQLGLGKNGKAYKRPPAEVREAIAAFDAEATMQTADVSA